MTKATFTASDRIEIHELTTAYGVHHDNRDFDRLRDCFTEDATYLMEIATGTTHGPRLGADAIIDQIKHFKASQDDKRRHHISNIQVTPRSDGSASVSSYVIVSATKDGAMEFKTVGTYADTVVRTDAGWRIQSKTLHLDSEF